jgi:hypothetical protein
MDDSLKWRLRNHSIIKGTLLGNIRNDSEIEPGLWHIWMSLFDLICLLLCANSGDNRVPALEE